VEEKIKEIIKEQVGLFSDLKNKDTLVKIGLDSLDVIEIVMRLEEEFMVAISNEVADKWKTVKDVINGVKELKGEKK